MSRGLKGVKENIRNTMLTRILSMVLIMLSVIFVFSSVAIAMGNNENVDIERIAISTSSKYVENYKDILLETKIYPQNATKKELKWESSNESIATVSQSGQVTTMSKSGSVTITATALDESGVSETIELIVGKNAVAVENKISLSFQTTYENIEWEFEDESIIEKISTGKIQNSLLSNPYTHSVNIIGKKSGYTKVNIKTTSGAILSTSELYVYNPITTITANCAKVELEPNETEKIDAITLPANVDQNFSDIYYLIGDSEIASIDDEGNMIAYKEGTTNVNIVAKYGDIKCTVPVKVAYFAKDLVVDTDEVNLDDKNDRYKLSYQLSPQNVTDKSVKFITEDDSVASVDKDGNVVATGSGSTVIKVISGDGRIEKEVKVNVSNFIAIERINLKDQSILVTSEGKIPNFQAKYEILPTNASKVDCTEVNWKVADENIAVVDENGVVTGISQGITTLTVKSKDGKYSDTCEIKVIKGYNEVSYLEVESYSDHGASCRILGNEKLYYGESMTLPEEKGYTINEIYLDFSAGHYINKINKNSKLSGNGDCCEIFVKRNINRLSNLQLKNMYEIWGDCKYISFYYTANFNEAIYDKLILTSSNTKVIDSDGYYGVDSNTTTKTINSEINGVIKGTGTTTIYIKNELGTVLAKKTITIINCSNDKLKDYKVVDSSVATPKISGISYINPETVKIKLGTKVNVNNYEVRIEYKGKVTNNVWCTAYKKFNKDGTITLKESIMSGEQNNKIDFRIYLVNKKDNDMSTAKSATYSYTHKVPVPDFSVKSGSYNTNKVTLGNNNSLYSKVEIYRATSKNGKYKYIGTANSKSTTYTDKGLTTGTTYYYKVKGTVKGYTVKSALSSVKSAKPTVAKTSGLTTKSVNTSSIQLKWNKVGGASGYQIYRYNTKTKKYVLIKTITKGSTLTYTDKNLTAGKTHQYKVRAYRIVAGQKKYGAYSSVLTTTTKTKAPTISKVTSGSKKATVKWKKVAGATGYEIYMATSKNGKYSKVGTVTKNSTVSYTKTGLTKNKTYYFKVRTYRTVNGKKVYSSYSAVKSVKVK